MSKPIKLGDIFSESDISKAYDLKDNHREVVRKIVKPNMENIDKITGQENDANYIGYLLIHALTS